jgi:hypothetical protein
VRCTDEERASLAEKRKAVTDRHDPAPLTREEESTPPRRQKLRPAVPIRRRLKKHWRRDPVALLALGTATVLTCFSGLQWRTLIASHRLSERAWVLPIAAEFRDVAAGRVPSVIVTFRNTGDSPALSVRTYASVQLQRRIVYEHTADMPQPDVHVSGVALMAPSAETRVVRPVSDAVGTSEPGHSPAKLSEHEIEALKLGEIVLVVWGRVEYADIFHRRSVANLLMAMPRTKHWTEYCYRSGVFADSATPNADACDKWNATDDAHSSDDQ